MKIARGIIKVCIALFCIWHMSAIFIYSLFNVDEVPVLAWAESKRPYIRPYILITSQWQRWNLFSPDPLRRVIELDIEILYNNEWQRLMTIDEDAVSWWQRAPELKTIRRMEDDNMQPLQERYLHDICKRKSLAEGTVIRMTKQWFIIPKHEKTLSAEWWNAWEPEWHSAHLAQTACPKPA